MRIRISVESSYVEEDYWARRWQKFTCWKINPQSHALMGFEGGTFEKLLMLDEIERIGHLCCISDFTRRAREKDVCKFIPIRCLHRVIVQKEALTNV